MALSAVKQSVYKVNGFALGFHHHIGINLRGMHFGMTINMPIFAP